MTDEILTTGCKIYLGKTLLSALDVRIEAKTSGLFYAYIVTPYIEAEYKILSNMCWNQKREIFKVEDSDGNIFKEFYNYALVMGVDTTIRVNDIVKNHYKIKLLNKVRA